MSLSMHAKIERRYTIKDYQSGWNSFCDNIWMEGISDFASIACGVKDRFPALYTSRGLPEDTGYFGTMVNPAYGPKKKDLHHCSWLNLEELKLCYEKYLDVNSGKYRIREIETIIQTMEMLSKDFDDGYVFEVRLVFGFDN